MLRHSILENQNLEKKVKKIGDLVKKDGDKSLLYLTEKYDGVNISSIAVKKADWNNAEKHIPQELKKAILVAQKNIKNYHLHQKKNLVSSPINTMKGIKCYRKFSAIERVGVYIPGGSAPLFSSVLMTVIPAKISGCREIVVCSPPQKNGNISPSIAYAAKICGATELYTIGGAQAVFAMAYGTTTIKPVLKIVGPGNSFVNEAKKQISTLLPIDMPAGPSEVMVIADKYQAPEIICSDLLSQLEHDPSSQAVFVSLDKSVMNEVKKLLPQFISKTQRKHILQKSMSHLQIIFAKNNDEAIKIANQYAPEHLIIATQNAHSLSEKIIHAGSVFIGNFSAESIGDYASGTNHTLPTNGYAKNYSGLSVESFGKWTSFQEISKEGFQRIAKTVKIMSQYEGLFEHQNAIIQREKFLLK